LNLELSYIPDTFIKQLIDIVSSLSTRQIIEPIALGLEYAGVVIIVYGAIVSLALLIKAEYRNTRQAGTNQHKFKQQFTSRLLTGLEFFYCCRYTQDHILTNARITYACSCDSWNKGSIDFLAE
jgi:uncharacterized membrane protein